LTDWLSDLDERIREAVGVPFRESNKSLIVSLHGEAFKSKLCEKCENEQILAYIELTRLIEDNTTMKKSNCKDYRIDPRHEGKTITISSKGWKVTAEGLTDTQALYMVRIKHPMIVTVAEAAKIRKQMGKAAKSEKE